MSTVDRGISTVISALQHDLDIQELDIALRPGSFSDINSAVRAELENDTRFEGITPVIVFLGGEVVGAVVIEEGMDPSNDETLSFALSAAAGQLQDQIVESLRSAWPKCPLHEHPLKAEEQNKVALWVCPTSGAVIAAIGALPPNAE